MTLEKVIVNSWNEWDPLKHVIVGKADGTCIPAADLTLLSLTEVIGGIFWVWLPWLGINEVPSTNTIIGGFFIFISIFYYSLIMQSNRRFIGLN